MVQSLMSSNLSRHRYGSVSKMLGKSILFVLFGVTISSAMYDKKLIILKMNGAFNPPTLKHLRTFEVARDHLRKTGQFDVIGGIISPCHESYNKPGGNKLAPNEHRREMLRLSVASSDWVRLSDWELDQPHWAPRTEASRYYQEYINSILNGTRKDVPNWLAANIKDFKGQRRVQIMELCGADTLSRLSQPSTQDIDNVEVITRDYGLMIVSRFDIDAEKQIFSSDLLNKFRTNITIARDWLEDNLSSTLVRKLIQRDLSIEYLVHHDVAKYIKNNKLYILE